MPQYATGTTVSVGQSEMEIKRTLIRYGATSTVFGWDGEQALVGFGIVNRQVKIVLPLPNRNERRFTHHSRGERTSVAADKEWEQACRQRWRA